LHTQFHQLYQIICYALSQALLYSISSQRRSILQPKQKTKKNNAFEVHEKMNKQIGLLLVSMQT